MRAKPNAFFFPARGDRPPQNPRRYGGYLVHMGVVLMFIGFTGKAFDQSTTVEVAQGGTVNLGRYQMKIVNMVADENDNYTSGRLTVAVSKDGVLLGELTPERRFYKAYKQ